MTSTSGTVFAAQRQTLVSAEDCGGIESNVPVCYSRGKFRRRGSCCIRQMSLCCPWKTTLPRGRSLVSSGGRMSLSQNIQGILRRFATGHRGSGRAQLGKQGHIYHKLMKKITKGITKLKKITKGV